MRGIDKKSENKAAKEKEFRTQVLLEVKIFIVVANKRGKEALLQEVRIFPMKKKT